MKAYFKKIWQYPKGQLQLRCSTLVILVFLVTACNNDDDATPNFNFPLEGDTLSISDISGNWTATLAEFEIVGEPTSYIELVEAGGSVSISIQNNGRFNATIVFPGESPFPFTGQLGFSGSQLVLLDDVDEPGDEAFLNIDLTAEGLLLISGIIEFDFDGNGNFEDTNINFILTQ